MIVDTLDIIKPVYYVIEVMCYKVLDCVIIEVHVVEVASVVVP